MTMKSVKVEADSKGKEKKDETDIVENFVLSNDSYRAISQAW
jgi:hypothetical protein